MSEQLSFKFNLLCVLRAFVRELIILGFSSLVVGALWNKRQRFSLVLFAKAFTNRSQLSFIAYDDGNLMANFQHDAFMREATRSGCVRLMMWLW